VLLGDIDLARIPPIRYDNPLLADLESGLPLLMPDLGRVMERAQGLGFGALGEKALERRSSFIVRRSTLSEKA